VIRILRPLGVSTERASLAPVGATLRIDTSGSSTRITAVERADDLEAWQSRLGEVAP